MRPILQEVRFAFPVILALAGCAHREGPAEPASAPPAVERAAPAEAGVPAGWKRYVVRHGDTLGRIAQCRRVSIDELARANGLDDPDRLRTGERLHVPPRDRCAQQATVVRAKTAPSAPESAAPPKEVAKSAASEAATVGASVPAVAAAPPPEEPAAAPAAPAAPPALAEARGTLDAATARYHAADFEGAIAGAEAAARTLEGVPRDAESDALRARCHALLAMAALALERHERALAELRTAFTFDPGLAFDPATTSPRVMELAEEARGKETAPQPK